MGNVVSGISRMQRMLADPDLTGDLLLLGLAMAASLDFGGKWPKVAELARETFGVFDVNERPRTYLLRQTLKGDMRTYRLGEYYGGCMAPMIRREGLCGRHQIYASGAVTDWATGEMHHLAVCSRHKGWFDEQRWANQAAQPTQPENVPLPPANHGGVLAKHFPEINWPKFWRKLDPSWVEHPEVVPWPKPPLTLLLGDDDSDSPVELRERPALAVVSTP